MRLGALVRAVHAVTVHTMSCAVDDLVERGLGDGGKGRGTSTSAMQAGQL